MYVYEFDIRLEASFVVAWSLGSKGNYSPSGYTDSCQQACAPVYGWEYDSP